MSKEAVGIRLEEKAIRALKVVAAERGATLSSLAQEALSQWWAQQPEAKIRGPLFPGEATPAPELKEKP